MGLSVFQPEKIKFPESIETLRVVQPDFTVVAAYGQILPQAVLRIPRVACLNVHGSILPQYRGAAPIHYAVMVGEKETGVTIMYMNEKMDEGDILLTRKTGIGPEETTGEVHDRLALLGAEGLQEALALLGQGKAPRIPQDHSKASYAPSLKREQCRIKWDSSSAEIVNKIRGLSPWPVAETQWRETQLRVHSASDAEGKPAGKMPGEVLRVSHEGIEISAGKGKVLIRDIQPPGKRKMSAFDFTLGHPDFKPGEILS